MKPKTWARKLTCASYEATIVSARRKPVALAGEHDQRDRQPLGASRLRHLLGLVRRDDEVVSALQQQDRRGQRVDVVDGGAVDVDGAILRVGADEAVEVARLELVGVSREDLEVADAVTS